MKRIEGMEELFLGSFFPSNELDIVDEQNVDVAVAQPEFFRVLPPDGVDQIICKLLCRDVPDVDFRIRIQDQIADRMQEVRLAKPHAPIKEEWIVGLRGMLGHGHARGVGKTVGRADDKTVEGIAAVEHRRARCRELELRGFRLLVVFIRGDRATALRMMAPVTVRPVRLLEWRAASVVPLAADDYLYLDGVAEDRGQRLGYRCDVASFKLLAHEDIRRSD